MLFKTEIKVGSFVKTTGVVPISVGMVKQIQAKGKDVYPAGNPVYDGAGWWSSCYGWRDKKIYEVNFGGVIKIMDERTWKSLTPTQDYTHCGLAQILWVPEQCLRLY
jgi:hypothetical protein